MTVQQRILSLLRDYAPLPLTYDDLQDELNLKRKHIQKEVSDLAIAGIVTREGRRGPGAVTFIRLVGDAQ